MIHEQKNEETYASQNSLPEMVNSVNLWQNVPCIHLWFCVDNLSHETKTKRKTSYGIVDALENNFIQEARSWFVLLTGWI